jgi:hypothetical protein
MGIRKFSGIAIEVLSKLQQMGEIIICKLLSDHSSFSELDASSNQNPRKCRIMQELSFRTELYYEYSVFKA